jgi:hypothetical protein
LGRFFLRLLLELVLLGFAWFAWFAWFSWCSWFFFILFCFVSSGLIGFHFSAWRQADIDGVMLENPYGVLLIESALHLKLK